MRGRASGVTAAAIRLAIAQRQLADARKHPEAGHDLHRLEADIVEAKRLVTVDKRRAEADVANRAYKARLEAELARAKAEWK
jgi:hypothetical protein